MQALWQKFWAWYERNYVLNVTVALVLFILQVVHLSWLGGEVIVERLTGAPFFTFEGIWQVIIILVDYTEIPAIFTMSLVYIDAWRRGGKWNSAVMLLLLHSQWLHIFWITDEFVVNTFSETSTSTAAVAADGHTHSTVLPPWLAWVAILIDYLEVPVIVDTAWKLWKAATKERSLAAVKEALDEE